MEDTGLSQNLLDTMTSNARNQLTNLLQTSFSKFPPQVAVYRKLAETVALLAANGNAIIIGRGGNAITRHIDGGYHIRVVAKMDIKAATIMKLTGITKREAEKLVVEKNDERDRFIKEFVKFDVEDPHNYHLFINLSLHSVDEVARIIIEGMKQKGILKI
jgi:cytidylate kinase